MRPADIALGRHRRSRLKSSNGSYTTGDNNRLTSDGTYDYEYDDEGNRTKKTHISSGDYVEYAWDHRNRLTSVTFRNSSGVKTNEVTYLYDAFDRRIAKDVDDDGNGSIDWGERYVYDGSDVALVYDESDLLIERLLYGPGTDQPLASEDGSGDVLWFLADNQGTIRDVAEYDDVSDTTSVVNHIQYGGFGNITAQSNASLEPRHTYTGREWDADSELFYYRARWYDPVVGRFISEDPIGFAAGDGNLSRYIWNSPTNGEDPDGTSPFSKVGFIAAKKAATRLIKKEIRERFQNRSRRIAAEEGFQNQSKQFAKEAAEIISDFDTATGSSWGEFAFEIIPWVGDAYSASKFGPALSRARSRLKELERKIDLAEEKVEAARKARKASSKNAATPDLCEGATKQRGGPQGFKSTQQRKQLEGLKNQFKRQLKGRQLEAFKEAIESEKVGEQFLSKERLREIFEEVRKQVKP